MAIHKEILNSWSKQGATQAPKFLRERIEKILTDEGSKIKKKNQLDIYLQGSYRNSTNILGSSDVDIVVQSNATFFSDISNLNTDERKIYNKRFDDATYTWKYFKNDVIETLKIAFGSSNVKVGNKSIKVSTKNYEADVIPCFEHRKYECFGNNERERKYISGIQFYTTKENNIVINYPKKHYSFGADKNHRTNDKYKPTIRIFKNIKKRLLEKGRITPKVTSSYFIESLLYNVPDQYFNNEDPSIRIANILNWLNSNVNSFPKFVCQNNQIYLFGSTQEQWNEKDARNFILELNKFWNEC